MILTNSLGDVKYVLAVDDTPKNPVEGYESYRVRGGVALRDARIVDVPLPMQVTVKPGWLEEMRSGFWPGDDALLAFELLKDAAK
ncbi:hypothetical protein LITTLEE_179 [Mycobacterium phage LittleE]|uniref:Uncharacterized protein n=2 Tax=Omegavirus TaxID=1623292 RepID=A0A3S9UB48_9CAUD|nr:hypothetical protein N860_gp165 [Mycobacterium phage Redno2]YP_008410558.1 hypothetical protein N857_gp169 [Mycobacterium phage Wanda]YP_009124124.1 hypothetical protein VC71_gp171 [Mycobacterium phage Minerva]YP_009637090.1 hypothetical protein FGG27_gp179 [Mycobacterium phage LittleE]ATN89887.1 hypothetical protein SEA_KLEIN_175 [Mycobacterium phage Klein]AWH13982.1 hypothetical protein SEA_HALLEY_172 [Mycobacterium phage Halley]AXQ52400.1 hypothetical protein SEA_ERICMILLARD_169 [Mycoba